MDASEFYDLEDRRYVSPTVSRDEQLGFVDTLRDTMGRNTAQINAQTERLGTNIPSSMGGLAGSGSYFTQRYQTTPLEARANTLKATAQAKALNDLMSNYERQMANRARQAYRSAARRASTSGGSGGGDSPEGEPKEYYENLELTLDSDEWANSGESAVTGYGMDGYEYWKNPETGKMLKTNDPNYIKGSDGYYHDRNAMRNNYQTVRTLRNGWQDKYTNPYTGEAIYFPAHSIKGYVGF